VASRTVRGARARDLIRERARSVDKADVMPSVRPRSEPVAARICQYPQHLPGVVLTSDATALTDELAENWSDSIPRVVLVEGFPGVGKSRVGREVVDRWPGLAVRVEVPEDFVSIEDVLLDVATRFDELGDEEMSSLEDLDLLSGLLRVMRKGALLVIDDVQRLLDPSTGIPQKELRRIRGAYRSPSAAQQSGSR
jgi:hypothetical protein